MFLRRGGPAQLLMMDGLGEEGKKQLYGGSFSFSKRWLSLVGAWEYTIQKINSRPGGPLYSNCDIEDPDSEQSDFSYLSP